MFGPTIPVKPAAVPTDQLYWAARPARDVIAELKKKEQAYFDFAERKGFRAMWAHALHQYFGRDPVTGEWATQFVNYDGSQDELLRFRLNQTRSFLKQLITMGIGNRPSFECSATNTDYDSIGQAETADNIIEYMFVAKYGERKERRTVEKGVLMGLAWSWVNWDAQGGELVPEPIMRTLPDGSQKPAIDTTTGKPLTREVKAGDITLKSLGPWEVFHEPTIEEFDEHLWRCVRERRSRWEVVGSFPELREQILGTKVLDEYAIETLFGFDIKNTNQEELIVKHWYHGPSAAMTGAKTDKGQDASKGRYIQYVGDQVLLDLPIPFPVIPLVDFCPAEYIGTAFGYADSWDLCSINQMLDQIVSDWASNLSAFGRQCVSVEEGTDFDADAIANGMRVLTRRPGTNAPEAIQLASIPQSTPAFVEFLLKMLQQLTGLNSVARGDPDANITSGTMAALFHSMAIEFNSATQAAVDSHRERLANLMLDILKQNARHPMIVRIAGVDERPYLDTFTRDKLMGVRGVVVKTSNPLMRTQAGRLQIAEMMLKLGAIQDPGQLTEVIVSGQVKPLYDAPRKVRMRIKLEDEMLLKGPAVATETPQPLPPIPGMPPAPPPQPYKHVPTVPVHWMDDHELHLQQHFAQLASREALENKAIWDAVNVHIDHHIKVWQETDPARLIAAKRKPYPRLAPPGMPPGAAAPGGKPMPRLGQGGKPANDNGAPDAMQPTDQKPSAAGRDPTLGTKLPEPAKSPVAGNGGGY